MCLNTCFPVKIQLTGIKERLAGIKERGKCARCHGKGKVPSPDSDERSTSFVPCPRCTITRECPDCNGSGGLQIAGAPLCFKCGGTGKIKQLFPDCPDCDGKGHVVRTTSMSWGPLINCDKCGGTGKINGDE
jgi:DnaJ-class molecular chaperone